MPTQCLEFHPVPILVTRGMKKEQHTVWRRARIACGDDHEDASARAWIYRVAALMVGMGGKKSRRGEPDNGYHHGLATL